MRKIANTGTWFALVAAVSTLSLLVLGFSLLLARSQMLRVAMAEAGTQTSARQLLPSATQAILVNSSSGELIADTSCTLPEAVFNANQNSAFYSECGSGAGAVVVTFAPLLAGKTISLTAALAISDDLTLDGSTAATVTLSAVYTTPVISIASPDIEVTLRDLTLSHGHSSGNGGAITNAGILTLLGTRFISNTAEQGGGGIFNSGTLFMVESLLFDNIAKGPQNGGALLNTGQLHLSNTEIRANRALYSGGGIRNNLDASAAITDTVIEENESVSGDDAGISNRGTMTLTRSSVINNSDDSDVGGIANFGTMWIVQSTIAGNQSRGTGGIDNYGVLSLMQSTVSNNHGGKIREDAAIAAQVTVCGGVNSSGVLTVTNSTISGNQFSAGVTSSYGGGLCQYGEDARTLIEFSTIADNSAEAPATARSGIWVGGGSLSLRSSIVSHNQGKNFAVDAGSQLSSLGHNLTASPAGETPFLNQSSDIKATDPELRTLAANGGPTFTHLFPGSSLAVDHGDNTRCPPVDQRGHRRPQHLLCDIGAVEAFETLYIPLVSP